MTSANWLPPAPLDSSHDKNAFTCGEAALDLWLKQKALVNQNTGATRTFVVSDPSKRVLGYYAMAAGAVDHTLAAGRIRRNMPNPVPVLLLARLAVDLTVQRGRLGGFLLRDAVLRAKNVSGHAGVRAMLVHALSESARSFYMHHGFEPSPVHDMTLMLKLW